MRLRATPTATTTRTARTTRTGLVSVAAALLLASCGGGGEEADGGASATAGGAAACRAGDVGVEVGAANAAPAAGDTGNVPVAVTNQGRPCTLDGMPGVRISAGGKSVEVAAQKGATAQPLELAEGGSASFTLTYVRGEKGAAGGFAADTLNVTLPGDSGESGARRFPWTYGPLAGTGADDISVGAFQQSGD
ncbi:MAG TPA: DUF4232 domain-containing protein [Streptomyces sp.]|nr:DUF4232 domain-containing protein [Streptomyces sp.]